MPRTIKFIRSTRDFEEQKCTFFPPHLLPLQKERVSVFGKQ